MATSKLTKAQLEERLSALEAENARLRDDLAAAPAPEPTPASGMSDAAPASAPRRRGRAVLGATLIVVAAILAPLSTVASYAASQISDTDRFVATQSPLADDPAIQALILDQAAVAIDDALDTDALVADLLDGIFDEDSTPRLAAAADLLGPLLADQTRTAVRSALTAVVESEQFATVWTETLTLTHSQVVAVLEGDGEGAVAIVAGLVAGTSAAAASARRAGVGVGDRLGASLDARGWRASDLARALASHRWLLWTALAAVLALCFALLKPLTPWDVALTGVLLALVAGAYGVLSAGSSPEPASDPAVDPV